MWEQRAKVPKTVPTPVLQTEWKNGRTGPSPLCLCICHHCLLPITAAQLRLPAAHIAVCKPLQSAHCFRI
jgi:hypothetical protein